jgi:hypothetical protein
VIDRPNPMADARRSLGKAAQPQQGQMPLWTIPGSTSRYVRRCVPAFAFWGALCFSGHSNSQQIYAFGVGTDSCSVFISQIVAPPGKTVSRRAPDDGRDYYSKSTIYLEWLLGFVTGYNAASGPQSQFQFDAAAVDLYVRNWCAQNPTGNIFTAVRQFLNKTDP